MSSLDVEKGLGEGPRTAAPPQNMLSISSGPADDRETPNREKTDLEIFQTLVGIRFLAKGGGPAPDTDKQVRPANPMWDIFRPGKTGDNRWRNRGLYDRTLSQDMKNRVLYTMSRHLLTGLYFLQIVLAATITGLSAEHLDSTVPLTTLGALNTVVAGLLAWFTGQGMPTRYRRARDMYRECVKQIEAAERMFAEVDYIRWPPGLRPDPVAERDRLEKMFEEARVDEEANYPNVHHSPSDNQMAQKNQELQGEIEKWKSQLHEDKSEVVTLQKELQALRKSMSVSPRGSL